VRAQFAGGGRNYYELKPKKKDANNHGGNTPLTGKVQKRGREGETPDSENTGEGPKG